MSYSNKYRWEIIPKNLPVVRRKCPKCDEKTQYVNSKKFRVNANKNSIDVWMIYQCEKCKSTWNMTIYERVQPSNIDKDKYKRFLSNDRELVETYAFDLSLYNKNKAEVILDKMDYVVVKRQLDELKINDNEIIIELICKYPMEIRIDKILGDTLRVSRSKIKNLYNNRKVFIEDSNNCINTKVKDKMKIHIVKDDEIKEKFEV